MTETQLLDLWFKARNQLILAQLAPTFLLITTVGLVPQIREAGLYVVLATLGILLASGILGALVEFTAAAEAESVARDMQTVNSSSHISKRIQQFGPWMNVAKYLTPIIFISIFVFLVLALTF